MPDMLFEPRFTLDTPYLADYFGLWMVHDSAILQAVERVQGMNLTLHMQSDVVRRSVSDRDDRSYGITKDGIATLAVRGPMMKAVASMMEGTSTVRLRQALRDVKRDKDARGLMLVMDTPGGTAKGNEDLANAVAEVAAVKPVYAYVEDMTASAGVSVASQATRRYANNATAIYGSMGTYAVLQDTSGMAEKLGVKVHVIRAGQFKGVGTPGDEITDEQLAEMQRIVNRTNEAYLGLIARGLGRSVDSIRPLADGRAIMAADAVEQGLLNGIQSYEATYAELLAAVGATSRKSTATSRSKLKMADNPATLAELKATFPNSSAEWRELQLEAEATLSEAAIDYAKHVEATATAEREKHAKELEEAKNSSKPSLSLGHQPLTRATVGGDEVQLGGDPIEDFDAAVRARLPKTREATMQERQAAIGLVARKNPQLHRAYIEATNSGGSKKVARMIAEKYDVQTS